MELNPQQKALNFVLTFIQYFGFALFLWWSPWIANSALGIIIQILGFGLAFWAIGVMQKSKISIAPRPKSNATLVNWGPYRIIRHPMYASIILVTLPIIIAHFDLQRMVFLAFLYANLIAKMLFEERLLKVYFQGYQAYSKTNWRIIPYLF
jgi:protein-S-isoprenylcysteine O-methyltransferase Ste14